MKSTIYPFLVVGVFLFFSCVHTQLTRLSEEEYPEVQPDDVMVYFSPSEIKGEYEKLGIIHAQGEGSWTNEHQMLETVRKKAGGIGANGVVWGDINEPSSGAKIAGALFGTGTTRRGQFVAIYVYEQAGYSDPQRDSPEVEDRSELQHVDFQDSGTKLERVPVQQPLRDDTSAVVEQGRKEASQTPPKTSHKETEQTSKLVYFRKVVEAAANFSDEQLLKMYRKKYPSLNTKSDEELTILIEEKYKKIYENQ